MRRRSVGDPRVPAKVADGGVAVDQVEVLGELELVGPELSREPQIVTSNDETTGRFVSLCATYDPDRR